jgi:hypothetical protein
MPKRATGARREAYRKYSVASRLENRKRYSSFDMTKSVMHITATRPPHADQAHPIGVLLLAFANLDLTEYEQARQHTLRLIRDPNTNYAEEGCYVGRMSGSVKTQSDAQIRDLEDLKYNRRVCADRFVRRFQGLHPYVAVFDSDYVTLETQDADVLLEGELNLMKLQEVVVRYIGLCLDEQVDAPYAKLTPVQRYALHARTEARLPAFSQQSTLYARAVSSSDASVRRQIARFETTKVDFQRIVEAQSFDDVTERRRRAPRRFKKPRQRVSNRRGVCVQTAREMAMLELSRMIMGGVRVRRCGYCGRYFMPKGLHDTKYCASIRTGEPNLSAARRGQRLYREIPPGDCVPRLSPGVQAHESADAQGHDHAGRVQNYGRGSAQYQFERCHNGEISVAEF